MMNVGMKRDEASQHGVGWGGVGKEGFALERGSGWGLEGDRPVWWNLVSCGGSKAAERKRKKTFPGGT